MLVAPQLENGIRGGAVEQVDSTARAAPLDVKAADAIAGDSYQVIVTTAEGKADELNQAFAAAGQVSPETQETLAVLAKTVQAGCDRLTVGPENLVAFKVDIAALAIP